MSFFFNYTQLCNPNQNNDIEYFHQSEHLVGSHWSYKTWIHKIWLKTIINLNIVDLKNFFVNNFKQILFLFTLFFSMYLNNCRWVPLWHRRLRIQHYYRNSSGCYCGAGSNPGQGISTCRVGSHTHTKACSNFVSL